MNETTKENSYTLTELLYYGFFAVMLVAKGFGLYSGQWPYTLALFVSAVLIAAKLVLSHHSPAEWAVIILLFALSAAVYYHSDEIGAIIIVATVVGMKDVSVKRVMKLGCFLWVITYSLCILISLLGLKPDIFRAQDKLGLGYVIRWSLGQPHPNVLQISCILLCMFIFYNFRFRGKKLIAATACMALVNLYIFLYSFSYTGIALAFFYLALNLYFSFSEKRKFTAVEKTLFVLIMPFCLIFSVFGPNVLKGRAWDICNKLLNTRFNIAKTYMSMNPVSLFGSGYCNELPSDLNNLDCSYVYALMHYGIVFFVLFFAGYTALIVYLIRKDRRNELSITLAMAVAAVSEPFFVNPSFKNISLIFLGEGLWILLAEIQKKAHGVREYKPVHVSDRLPAMLESAGAFGTSCLEAFRKHAGAVLVTALAVGVLAGGIYAANAQMPEAYIMFRDTVQVNGEKGFTFDINDMPDDLTGEILEYKDAETPMMRLDGNAVKLEYVRNIVSITVWCVVLTAVAATFVFYLRDRRRKYAG